MIEAKPRLDARSESVESIEPGEWKSAGGKRERWRYTRYRYVKATFRNKRRLNIRLSTNELQA